MPLDPKHALKHVLDVDGLYKIIGNTIIEFMKAKPQPFLANALASQENFWRVPTYKRAMTFVFLVRYVLGYPSQSQWKKFSVADLKLNTRTFKRWENKEIEIMEESDKLSALDEESPPPMQTKRKKSSSDVLTSDSPMKRIYVVDSDSTEDEA